MYDKKMQRKLKKLKELGIDIDKCGCTRNDIINYLTNNNISDNKNFIRLLKYENKSFNLIERLNQIKELGNDSSSLNAYILRYGEELGTKKFKEKCANTSYTKLEYIEKFGKDKFLFDRGSNNDKNRKKRYGESAENVKLKYLSKWRKSHTKEGYIEKYGEELGTKKFNNKIEKYKKTNGLEGYIEKYGEELGTKKFNERISKMAYKLSKEYYIEVYGKTEGLKKLREIKNTNSLESYIKRLGPVDGKIEYNKYCEKISKIAIDNEFHKHFNSNWNSKIANEYFEELISLMDLDMLKENIYYKDNEYSIFSKEYKRIFFYDFKYKNKIIEFNGDFWHANPSIYDMNDIHPVLNIKNNEIVKMDLIKQETTKVRGFDLLVIWENDVRKNRNETLRRCINFLKDNKNG